MKNIQTISELPGVAAVYAMYGGKDRGSYVAYVGVAGNLKRRVMQHLVRRDSSVATGTSAVMLNPAYVTQVRWWEHSAFEERPALEAAELVAFEVFDPALRSRGAIQEKARQLFEDTSFREEMRALFDSEPSGQLNILTLQDALEKIESLEERLTELQRKLRR
jgi:hypothetical protein